LYKVFRNAKTPFFNLRNADGRYNFLLMLFLFSGFYTCYFLSVLLQDDISCHLYCVGVLCVCVCACVRARVYLDFLKLLHLNYIAPMFK